MAAASRKRYSPEFKGRLALQLQRPHHRCSRKLAGKVMDEQGLRSLSPGPHSSTR